MNNLKTTCGDIESFTQIRKPKPKPKPKPKNIELVSLNLAAEYRRSINTESQLFICFKNTDLKFKIELSVYNKRRKKLLNYTESIRKRIDTNF